MPLDDLKHDYVPKKVTYYPLVSLLFLLGGLMVLLPSIFYRVGSKRSGIDVAKILEAVQTLNGNKYSALALADPQRAKSEVYANIGQNMNIYRRKSKSVLLFQ